VSMGGASGRPCRSTITWCLEPIFPRSVGFLPTCAPPFWPERARSRRTRVTSRPRPLAGVAPEGAGGRAATPPSAANPAAGSSRSFRCIRALAADLPTESRCAGRTRSPSAHSDPMSADVRALIGGRVAGATAQ
jgi:hypothetical protein